MKDQPMTDELFSGTGNLELEIRRVEGTWYAHLPQTALWGSGSDPEAAVAQLNEQHRNYADFLSHSGTPPLDLLTNRPTVPTLRSRLGRVARLVAVIALCAIPVSYGLSTGIERGFDAAAKNFPLKGLLPKIEQSVIAMGSPDYDLPPERAKALGDAVRRIVDRLAPFTAQAADLFNNKNGPKNDTSTGESN